MTSNPVNPPHCFPVPVVGTSCGAKLCFKLIYNLIGRLVQQYVALHGEAVLRGRDGILVKTVICNFTLMTKYKTLDFPSLCIAFQILKAVSSLLSPFAHCSTWPTVLVSGNTLSAPKPSY